MTGFALRALGLLLLVYGVVAASGPAVIIVAAGLVGMPALLGHDLDRLSADVQAAQRVPDALDVAVAAYLADDSYDDLPRFLAAVDAVPVELV